MGLFNASIAEILTRLIVVLIAMDVHEFAHAYVAYRMGDTTARDMGKLTLNPFVNIHWLGFLMWVFIGFGILGTAPVDERRMYNRRWGMLAAVAAGPLANLLMAAVFAIPFFFGVQPQVFCPRDFIPTIPQILTLGVQWNLLLFLFNLLPIFPLDGWTILIKLVPPELGYTLSKYQTTSMYIFMGIILLGFISPSFNLFSLIIVPPLRTLMMILRAIPFPFC